MSIEVKKDQSAHIIIEGRESIKDFNNILSLASWCIFEHAGDDFAGSGLDKTTRIHLAQVLGNLFI